MKILSWNVRLWTRDTDHSLPTYWVNRSRGVKELLTKESPDVILLQEAVPPMSWMIKPKGYRFSGLNFHHTMFIKKGLSVRRNWCGIRLQGATVDGIEIVNVHSSWKPNVLKKTIKRINKICPVVAMGDFNATTDAINDLLIVLDSVPEMLQMEETSTLQDFNGEKKSGIVDHAFSYIPSWDCDTYRVLDAPDLSDHKPIVFTFRR